MGEKDASKSVMGNLPSTRPARIGGRRDSRNGTAEASTPKPAAAKAKPTPKPKAAKPAPKPKAAGSKPRAVRSGSPALKAAKAKSTPRRPEPAKPPQGAELVTTAVQAAGELVQIGFTLGAQAAKRAVRRLPKP